MFLSTPQIVSHLTYERILERGQRLLTAKDKHASMSFPPSRVVGCDFSGTVEKLGDAVDQSKFRHGDRIAGIIHGCKDTHTGAFAEHLVADANLCFKIPDNVSLEQASTIGVGWISAMQALRKFLYSDKPESNGDGESASDQNILAQRWPRSQGTRLMARIPALDLLCCN